MDDTQAAMALVIVIQWPLLFREVTFMVRNTKKSEQAAPPQANPQNIPIVRPSAGPQHFLIHPEPPGAAEGQPQTTEKEPTQEATGQATTQPPTQSTEQSAEDKAHAIKEQAQGTKTDLERLERIVGEGKQKHREATEALRTIRDRKLYRLTATETNIPGWPADGFDSFDDYMECRWNRSRQWATQEINWLRACEALEASGNHDYHFSKRAIQPAAFLLREGWQADDPEGFAQVYLWAAEKGVPVTEDAVQDALKRYQRVKQFKEEWHRRKPQDAPELSDSEALDLASLGDATLYQNAHTRSNLVAVAQQRANSENGNWEEKLVEECQLYHKLPQTHELLQVVRGEGLNNVVKGLQELQQRWQEAKKAKEALAKLKKEKAATFEEATKLGAVINKAKAPKKNRTKKEKEEEMEPKEPSHPRTAAEPEEPEFLPTALRFTFVVFGVLNGSQIRADEFSSSLIHGNIEVEGWPEELVLRDEGGKEVGKVAEIDWQLHEIEEEFEEDRDGDDQDEGGGDEE